MLQKIREGGDKHKTQRDTVLMQLLTKCPGVGERESFSPADPGTSRRGHFICRYYGREGKSGKNPFKKYFYRLEIMMLTRPLKSEENTL